MEYATFGDGPPVLVLHGGHSNCRETLCCSGLEKFRVVLPSRPGYGRTPLEGHADPESAAALCVALLDDLGLSQVHVLGVSAGGPTAIALAANFPDRVDRLLLASAVTRRWLRPGDAMYAKANKLFRPGMEKFSWALMRLFVRVAPRSAASTLLEQFSTRKDVEPDARSVQDLAHMLRRQSSGRGFMADLQHEVPPGWLSAIKASTLVVHSRNDASVPVAHAHHANDHLAHGRLLLLDNTWGHMLWLGEDRATALQAITGHFMAST